MGYRESELLLGDQVLFTQTLGLTPLETRKTYIASLWFMACEETGRAIAKGGPMRLRSKRLNQNVPF